MKNRPDKIWLCLGEDTWEYDDFEAIPEVDWCVDKCSPTDLPYIQEEFSLKRKVKKLIRYYKAEIFELESLISDFQDSSKEAVNELITVWKETIKDNTMFVQQLQELIK